MRYICTIMGILFFMAGCACEQGLEKATKENTVMAYSDFLETSCKEGKCAKQAEIAKKRKEEAEKREEDEFFKNAKNANTMDAYENYLDKYPQGRYVDKAKEFRTRLWLTTEMSFDKGIRLFAQDMKRQIQYLDIFRTSSYPATINPFKVSKTGEELTVNFQIQNLLSERLYRYLTFIRMSSKGFADAKFIMDGIITQEQNPEKPKISNYHVYSILYEKDTGKILASADTWLGKFDDSPIDADKNIVIYNPEPVSRQTAVKMQPGETVPPEVRVSPARGAEKECDDLYEKDKENAVECYERIKDKSLRIYSLLYKEYYSSGNLDKAKINFAKSVELNLKTTGNIESKLKFAINSTGFLTEELAQEYALRLEVISRYLEREGICIRILGHSSITGDPKELSKRRAERVQQIMRQTFPQLSSEAIGMGTQGASEGENEYDRRVEFKIVPCEELKP